MNEHVDYDAIAETYDRRYERETHGGVERAIAAFVGDDATSRILEVGCGTGHWLARLGQRGFTNLAGLDASEGMLAVAETKDIGADLRHGDANALPWDASSFDRVVCVHALHHFTDKAACISEARRVLTDDGGLITFGLDPHVGLDRWVVYDMFEGTLATDRRRYPPTATIRAWMTAAGFAYAETFVASRTPERRPARDALAAGYLDRDATSQLTLLSDADYRSGISQIERQIHVAEEQGKTYTIASDLRVYATIGWVQ